MNTGKMTTIARPYAVAAFEIAVQKNAISAWETMLSTAALVVQDERVSHLLANPKITANQLGDWFCEVLTSVLDQEKTNFIRMLAEKRRLAVLPDIALLFKTYREEREKMMTVQVTSATALDTAYQKKLAEKLTKKLQRQVTLTCSVDPNLIAGLKVTAGDTVIDGSVRGKLNRLLESL